MGLLLADGGWPVWATDPFGELRAVTDLELAHMRGGYSSAGGVEVAFGIESAVFIDGTLQAVTSFNSTSPGVTLPGDLAIVDNAELSAAVRQELVTDQLSAGSMDVEAVRTQLVTVVQNSEDHRIIDNITQLNATVTSLEAFRQSRFFDALQQQIIAARR